jgi:hypothetical protein
LPVLTPVAGFNSFTAPEISGETENIQEGNWMFQRKVLKNATISPMTMTRGVTFYEADFWYWMKAGLYGDTEQFESFVPGVNIGGPTYRRNLMLIHFFSRSFVNPPDGGWGNDPTAQAIIGDLSRAGLLNDGLTFSDPTAGATLAGLSFALSQGLNALMGGGFEFAQRVPARAFILYGCIPKRYKTGSDFDASSGDISIAELEIECEMFEQVGLV